MTHCLVTFLGRVPRHQGDGTYKRVEYRFTDGYKAHAAFLGFPLREWLRADRLVVFGTTSSMWDHLLEKDVAIQGGEHERLALMEDVEKAHVSQAQLDELAPRLAEQLGCDVQLTIIPAALEPAEQTHLLSMLANAAQGSKQLSLDVTHGFRHLPMLAFAAALYLRFLRPELKLEGLWYGALDPKAGSGTVHNLGGLLDTADWLSALQRHDWLGDYSGIADLVAKDDRELAESMRAASFRESIHQGQQARTEIRSVRERLRAQPLQGPGELFQPTLLERMAWVDEQNLYRRQRRHALSALDRGDYLRASLYGFEAFVTRLVQDPELSGRRSADPNDHDVRANAQTRFRSEQQPRERWQAFGLLRDLRNVLAHGNRPEKKDAQSAIDDETALCGALRECLDELLPDKTQ